MPITLESSARGASHERVHEPFNAPRSDITLVPRGWTCFACGADTLVGITNKFLVRRMR